MAGGVDSGLLLLCRAVSAIATRHWEAWTEGRDDRHHTAIAG